MHNDVPSEMNNKVNITGKKSTAIQH